VLHNDGRWYDHEARRGGRGPTTLVAYLLAISATKACDWCRDWLAQHPGDGSLDGTGAAEAAADASERRASWARQILNESVAPADTPAAAYLESRGILAPYPGCVRWLADARTGESAIIGLLTNPDGEVVGVQLGFLDPRAGKSTVQPRRQIVLLNKERSEPAAFRISVPEPAEDAAALVIVEGLEDALSVAQAVAARQVIGIPGVGRFGKFDLPAGADVMLFRDGDDPTSPAAQQLSEVVERWVAAGVRVRIVDTPAGADANSLLVTKGPAELRRLIAEAAPAELGFDADVERLAGLGPLDYERERAGAAARHSVRIAFLDAAVKAARAEAEAAVAEEGDDEALHPEPVLDLGPVLDQALAEVQRYVVGAEPELAAVVLWAAHAFLLHHDAVHLSVSPKLNLSSPDRGCGKTTLLEVIGALVPRPETGSSITAAVTFRLIQARRPTLLIDEADRVLRNTNEELMAVLNSSHRRSGAYVWRVEEIGGERVPVKFSTWAACAFAGIRSLPSTLQDRSIIVRLSKARPGEVLAHLRNGTAPALREIKRQIARWAADLLHLPEPALPPALFNRAGDNWGCLFAIAHLAGGRWPQLVQQAALGSLMADTAESTLVHLLEGIRRAFGERTRLRTRELLDVLLASDEFDFTAANRGKPINDAWLRERLRDVITRAEDGKPGSERWGSGNNKERGYSRGRFEDAWARYLPSSPATPNHPVHPADPAPPLKTNGNSGPDEHTGTRPGPKTTRPPSGSNGAGPDAEERRATSTKTIRPIKKSIKSKAGPGVPDGPGNSRSLEEGPLPANGELWPEELL
jgi:uncharacterized protein DUF3631/Toprim domain-containing protein